jgi:excisionase family DNA binding protein
MPNNFLLLAEVAAEARVSLSTVRHWVTVGKLATVRPGRRRMVRREDLDAFLASDVAPGGGVVLRARMRSRRESIA